MCPARHLAVIPEAEATLADALQTIDVDLEAYRRCAATYVPGKELVARWYTFNPAIYVLLRDNNTGLLAGYINAMPVTDALLEAVVAGDFDEREIGADSLRRYEQPGLYRLYFCSIAIRASYRNSTAFRQLLSGFAERLALLSTRRIYVRDMVVDAVTASGVSACMALGLQHLGETTRGSRIYRAVLLPPAFHPITDSLKNLYEVYAAHAANQ